MQLVEVGDKLIKTEADRDSHQSLVIVTHSPKGYRLKRPVKFIVPKVKTPGDKAIQEYIIDSFILKMSSLISFSFSNTSVTNLAKYFLRHMIGSKATLYQYVYGVYRFSNWNGKSPDAMIEDCQSNQKAMMNYATSIDDFIGDLQAEGLAPGTISNYVKSVKTLLSQ